MKPRFVSKCEKDNAFFSKWHRYINIIAGITHIIPSLNVLFILRTVIKLIVIDMVYYSMCWYMIVLSCLEFIFAFHIWNKNKH